MYRVVERFADLQDSDYIYEVGDTFPREGADVTDERIAELESDTNKIGRPLIEKVIKSKKKAEPKIDEAEIASEAIDAE